MKWRHHPTTVKWLYFLCIIYSFIFSKCQKDELLPEFYFRCIIDGLNYLPNGCANCMRCDIYGDSSIIMWGNRDFETLRISIDNQPIKIGQYQLVNQPGKRATYKNATTTDDFYRTQNFSPGVFNISELDKGKQIIAGSFYFVAYHSFRSNDSVIISAGKFRLHYFNN